MNVRVRALDGIRGIAILLVIVGHGIETAHPSDLERLGGLYLGNAAFGVDLFFVLSGYLITSLLVREREATRRIDIRRFYMRRARRILPPFYVWLAVVALLDASHVVRVSPRELLGSALLYSNYMPAPHAWWVANTWSLCIEEHFYLLFPALVLLFGYRAMLAPLIGLIAFEPVARALECRFALSNVVPVLFQSHLRIDPIAYGCVLAIVLRDARVRTWFESASARRIAIAALLVGVVVLQTLYDAYHLWFNFFIGLPIESASAAFVVAYVIVNPASPASRFLASAPLVWIGTISFSLYLWQQAFMTTLDPIPFPLNVVAAFLVAWASYALIERPMAAASRRIDERRKRAGRAPAPAHAG